MIICHVAESSSSLRCFLYCDSSCRSSLLRLSDACCAERCDFYVFIQSNLQFGGSAGRWGSQAECARFNTNRALWAARREPLFLIYTLSSLSVCRRVQWEHECIHPPLQSASERWIAVMPREIKVICQCAHIKVALMKRWAMGKMIFDMKGCRWMDAARSTPCWDNWLSALAAGWFLLPRGNDDGRCRISKSLDTTKHQAT